MYWFVKRARFLSYMYEYVVHVITLSLDIRNDNHTGVILHLIVDRDRNRGYGGGGGRYDSRDRSYYSDYRNQR